MRYTCYKTIVTKIYDGILNESNEILSLLKTLKHKEMTCSLRFVKGPLYDIVRIMEIEDENITWRLVKDGVSLIKTTSIMEIDTIEVYSDDEVVQLKPDPSRWGTLDVSSS